MERTFGIYNLTSNLEVGRFSISVSKKGGVEYNHILGESPNWKDLAAVVTMLFAKVKLETKDDKYIYSDCYELCPNNRVDCRFVPLLVNTKLNKAKKLSFTIDNDRILEHHFEMPFAFAIKVMLALSMSYEGRKYLKVDSLKVPRIRHQRASKEIVRLCD